jgi:hypothetical protein
MHALRPARTAPRAPAPRSVPGAPRYAPPRTAPRAFVHPAPHRTCSAPRAPAPPLRTPHPCYPAPHRAYSSSAGSCSAPCAPRHAPSFTPHVLQLQPPPTAPRTCPTRAPGSGFRRPRTPCSRPPRLAHPRHPAAPRAFPPAPLRPPRTALPHAPRARALHLAHTRRAPAAASPAPAPAHIALPRLAPHAPAHPAPAPAPRPSAHSLRLATPRTFCRPALRSPHRNGFGSVHTALASAPALTAHRRSWTRPAPHIRTAPPRPPPAHRPRPTSAQRLRASSPPRAPLPHSASAHAAPAHRPALPPTPPARIPPDPTAALLGSHLPAVPPPDDRRAIGPTQPDAAERGKVAEFHIPVTCRGSAATELRERSTKEESAKGANHDLRRGGAHRT